MSEEVRAAATASEPDGAPRIAVLDILRGVAILGILFMNIDVMGRSLWAVFHDFKLLGWSSADQVAWWVREILADGTARCLLEMLFGAGMVILTERASRRAGEAAVWCGYYRRNIILFLFGLGHVFILLWPGDILHTYGLAALVAFLFRRMRPRWLITIGLLMAVLQLLGAGYAYRTSLDRRAEVARIEALQESGKPLSADDRKILESAETRRIERDSADKKELGRIAAEDAARSGTFSTWAAKQWDVFFTLQGWFLEPLFIWEAVSVMLIGAALFRLGILQGGRSRRYYLGLTLISYAVAVPMRVWSGYEQVYLPDAPHLGAAFYEVARLAMTLGHVGLINLAVMSAAGARLLQPFVAAGRTALSIYIAQTIIALWILYPPFALGLYGDMSWWSLMLTGVVINALLLWAANIYVRHYDIGPVEWGWRSLVERRLLPLRGRPKREPPKREAPVSVSAPHPAD